MFRHNVVTLPLPYWSTSLPLCTVLPITHVCGYTVTLQEQKHPSSASHILQENKGSTVLTQGSTDTVKHNSGRIFQCNGPLGYNEAYPLVIPHQYYNSFISDTATECAAATQCSASVRQFLFCTAESATSSQQMNAPLFSPRLTSTYPCKHDSGHILWFSGSVGYNGA